MRHNARLARLEQAAVLRMADVGAVLVQRLVACFTVAELQCLCLYVQREAVDPATGRQGEEVRLLHRVAEVLNAPDMRPLCRQYDQLDAIVEGSRRFRGG